MKLQLWQLSNLIFEAEQIQYGLVDACGREDTPITKVIDMQERLARIQLTLLKHFYEIELERTP